MMAKLGDLVGKTPVAFDTPAGGNVILTCSDGSVFRWFNGEENTGNDAGVWLEDCGGGELSDLIGHPLVEAEEESGVGKEENQTWTFVKLRSHGGAVTMRFYGESNGYYSESPEFERVK